MMLWMTEKCCGRAMFALGCRFVNEHARVLLGKSKKCMSILYPERAASCRGLIY